MRGHGAVEEHVALSHVLAEVALHHAGVDEVFEEGHWLARISECGKGGGKRGVECLNNLYGVFGFLSVERSGSGVGCGI